jgi:hypothetical protein
MSTVLRRSRMPELPRRGCGSMPARRPNYRCPREQAAGCGGGLQDHLGRRWCAAQGCTEDLGPEDRADDRGVLAEVFDQRGPYEHPDRDRRRSPKAIRAIGGGRPQGCRSCSRGCRGVPRAQVALAWLLAKPVITAPIVGATKLHHLDDALASVNVKLSADEITSLEEPYVPHAVVGVV